MVVAQWVVAALGVRALGSVDPSCRARQALFARRLSSVTR